MAEYRFQANELHYFIENILRYAGSNPEETSLVADHLVAANLAGHDSHGVGMIPSYIRSLTQGYLQLNGHVTVVKDTGPIITLDGNASFGQVAAYEAMSLGIERAKKFGVAAVALHNSHHIGRVGHWAEQCAAEGLISIHFVNVTGDPMVAPFGGRDRRFGTNPLCVVFPRKDNPPLLLDFATSAIAFGKTRVAWHKKVQVPAGCLIDSQGRPTTDPAVMHTTPSGSLLAFAKHKGYAIATLCEILGGALSGGHTTHTETLKKSADAIFNCMTTVIIDPESFAAPNLQHEADAFITWVKQSPQTTDEPIQIPGEWEMMNRKIRLAEGIPLDQGSWSAICDAAILAGMPEDELNSVIKKFQDK